MTVPPLAKRAYELAAMFALLNVIGLVGAFAMLVTSGAVNGERVQMIAGILRGELPGEGEGEVAEETVDQPPDDSAAEAVVAQPQDPNIVRHEADRIKVELAQQLALVNSIRLRVTNDREIFRQERESATRRDAASTERRSGVGFKKQIELYESLSPKLAVQHLLGLDDSDEAARVLIAMETRKAKKIIESAKGGADLVKMQEILRRMREVAPDRQEGRGTGP